VPRDRRACEFTDVTGPDTEIEVTADVRAIIEEMIAAWADAPELAPHLIKSPDRAESAEVGAEGW
jgi:hypothetical protein